MFLILTALLVSAATASAVSAKNEAIWDTHAKTWIQPGDLALRAQAGDIFVMGEDHGITPGDPEQTLHHDNQLRLIQALQQFARPQQISLSVGMEFLSYTAQSLVDQFVSGTLPEADFLKAAKWGGNPFEFYRAQILATRTSGGHTVALNLPGEIPAQVAKGGPNSLSAAQKAFLPPVWERGNDAYFNRFAEIMKGHAKKEQIENYFWAQSLWDDTMAWKALEHRGHHPKDILLIIVGAFHAEFDGGLPSELRKLGAPSVKTVLQLEAEDWSDTTLRDLVAPDPTYGPSADYLWVHQGTTPSSMPSVRNQIW